MYMECGINWIKQLTKESNLSHRVFKLMHKDNPCSHFRRTGLHIIHFHSKYFSRDFMGIPHFSKWFYRRGISTYLSYQC